MTYKSRAIKSVSFLFIFNIFAAFFGYLIRIVLARNITPAEYGLFFSGITLVNFLAIFRSLGLGEALVKYVPEFQVKKKFSLITQSITSVFLTNTILSLLIGLVLFLLASPLANHYFHSPENVTMISFLGILFFIFNIKDLIKIYFHSFQKMYHYAIVYFFENFLLLILLIISFSFSSSFLIPFLVYSIVPVILLLVFWPALRKTFSLHPVLASKKLFRKLLSFGFPMTIFSLSSMIIVYTDTLILTLYVPLQDVGIYNAVVPTVMLLSFFGSAIVKVLFPMFSELHARRKNEEVVEGMNQLLTHGFVLLLPFALALFLTAEHILTLLFGQVYSLGASSLQILVVGVVFLVFALINLNTISALGFPKITSKVMLFGSLFNVIANFILIPSMGILGAAVTSLTSYFIIFVWSLFEISSFLNVRPRWNVWLKASIIGLLSVAATFYLLHYLVLPSFLFIICGGIILFVLYFTFLLLLKIIKIKEIRSLLSLKK